MVELHERPCPNDSRSAMKKNRDLVILAVLIAIAALLAWLLRRKQLIPVVTTKILPAPPPSIEIVSGPVQGPSLPGGGFSTGGARSRDTVGGDARPPLVGLPASFPPRAHVGYSPLPRQNLFRHA